MSPTLGALRLTRIEAAITAGVIAWGVVEALTIAHDLPVGARVAFAIAATAPLVLRNVAPFPIFGWACLAFLADGRFDVLPIYAVTPFQGLLLALYAVTAHAQPRRLARFAGIAAVPALPLAFVVTVRDTTPTVYDTAALAVIATVAGAAGWLVRRRHEATERQRERLRRAEGAAPQLLEAVLADERATIAEELGAIVARDLGAAERLLARSTTLLRCDAARATAAAEQVQRTAAEAVAEMRRLLSVLRVPETELGQPAGVRDVVGAAQARGWKVTVRTCGAEDELSPGAAVAAARIVEELLEGAPVARAIRVVLRIDHTSGGVRLRLSGRGAAPAAVRSPASGVAERARLHGGAARGRRLPALWWVIAELPGASPITAAPWHAGRVAADVAVVSIGLAAVAVDALDSATSRPAFALVTGLALVVAPLVVRRRWPIPAALWLAGGLVVREALEQVPPEPFSIALTVLLGAYGAAAFTKDARRAAAATSALACAGLGVTVLHFDDSGTGLPYTDLPIVAFLAATAYAAGRLVRENDWHMTTLLAGHERLSAEQRTRRHAAVRDERSRVARDLHDVVGHGVSLVGVLAGAAAATATSDPRASERALGDAAATVAQMSVELARLTGALDASDEVRPPVLAELPSLIAGARSGGQSVRLELVDVDSSAVSAGVGASAYRIVQESLTNARKHAPGSETTVQLRRERHELLVEVRNACDQTAATPGAGHGIAGMGERARLLGGELRAGPDGGGGFSVRARLPVS